MAGEHLMAALKARYGESEGEAVYMQMMAAAKGPFGPRGSLGGQHRAFAERMGVDPLAGDAGAGPVTGPPPRRKR